MSATPSPTAIEPTLYDAIIVGAGQAGPSLARRLTAAGQRVALVERKLLGGTCVNIGCTPTKAMIASAETAFRAAHATDWGIDVAGGRPDLVAIQRRRDAIVKESRDGLQTSIDSNDHLTLLRGTASFVTSHVMQVTASDGTLQQISAPKIFLNVGARAHVPELPGIHSVPYLTSTSLLALAELPAHLIVIGGSYIGLEFAQMYARFGSRVTVVEKKPCLAAKEDEDISTAVRSLLEAEGITVRTSAACIALAPAEGGIAVTTNCSVDSRPVVGTHALLALGRRPNTDDLGCDRAGLHLDEHGYIVVNDECKTNVDGIYAMGDCNGRGAFTHTAYNDYEIVAANLLDGGHRRIADRILCYAMYTDPPLAHIGMHEGEVRALGKPALTASMPMAKVNRQRERGETLGLMKVFVDAETKLLLGATILGAGGDEAIHALLATMYADATYTRISEATYIHPTLSELLPTLLQSLKPMQ